MLCSGVGRPAFSCKGESTHRPMEYLPCALVGSRCSLQRGDGMHLPGFAVLGNGQGLRQLRPAVSRAFVPEMMLHCPTNHIHVVSAGVASQPIDLHPAQRRCNTADTRDALQWDRWAKLHFSSTSRPCWSTYLTEQVGTASLKAPRLRWLAYRRVVLFGVDALMIEVHRAWCEPAGGGLIAVG